MRSRQQVSTLSYTALLLTLIAGSCLETLHKILSRHLLDLACQLQFKQRCEDFRRRNGRLKLFHQFIDVGGFVSLEQRKNLFFVRRKVAFLK